MSHQISECIFCQIIARQIPSEIIFENEEFIAIRDINPRAPTHILIIPQKAHTTLEEILPIEPDFGARLLQTASQIAHEQGISSNYKLHLNVGHQVQQVKHLHLHLLGGWPEDQIPQ